MQKAQWITKEFIVLKDSIKKKWRDYGHFEGGSIIYHSLVNLFVTYFYYSHKTFDHYNAHIHTYTYIYSIICNYKDKQF